MPPTQTSGSGEVGAGDPTLQNVPAGAPGDIVSTLRAQVGESELIKDLDPKDVVPHQILVAYDIFTGLDPDDVGLGEFVGEVLKFVGEQA